MAHHQQPHQSYTRFEPKCPTLSFPEHTQRFTYVVLPCRPIERHAVTRPFLKNLANLSQYRGAYRCFHKSAQLDVQFVTLPRYALETFQCWRELGEQNQLDRETPTIISLRLDVVDDLPQRNAN